jgi:uncharacterized protein
VQQSRRQSYADGQDKPWQPVVTYTLLGVFVGVLVLERVAFAYSEALFYYVFTIGVDWPVRPWSLVTSTVSHADVWHLFSNGLFLFFMGPQIEKFLGARRYMVLFFAAGAVSGVCQVLIQDLIGDARPALGASGAIMMIVGLTVVLTPKAKILFNLFIPMPMWLFGLFYAFIDVVGAFNPYDGVGNFAHLSGMALGAGYGLWVRHKVKKAGLRLVY